MSQNTARWREIENESEFIREIWAQKRVYKLTAVGTLVLEPIYATVRLYLVAPRAKLYETSWHCGINCDMRKSDLMYVLENNKEMLEQLDYVAENSYGLWTPVTPKNAIRKLLRNATDWTR